MENARVRRREIKIHLLGGQTLTAFLPEGESLSEDYTLRQYLQAILDYNEEFVFIQGEHISAIELGPHSWS